MRYDNKEMKVQDLLVRFKDNTLNLVPDFQRKSVWSLPQRKKLIESMMKERPIPSIFFFFTPSGAADMHNILDGKQRVETLLLFLGTAAGTGVKHYFRGSNARKHMHFPIKLGGKSIRYAQMSDDDKRRLMRYSIATIEIDLDSDESSMDDVISLFHDVNSSAKLVNRLDMARGFQKRHPLFEELFQIIAFKRERYANQPPSRHLGLKKGDITFVLKRLQAVLRETEGAAKIDQMWERLTEIALFTRDGKHKSSAIKILIADATKGISHQKLNVAEARRIRDTFAYLRAAYTEVPGVEKTRFATDLPYFYTLITTLLATSLASEQLPANLAKKLVAFNHDLISASPSRHAREFLEHASQKTTHPDRREKRQKALVAALAAMDT